MAKAKYGAVPMNAIGDPWMTLRRFRVLVAGASYDRFTKNGMGCTAGLKGLAKATGLHVPDVSVAVNDLVETGYLIRQWSLFDRRRMTLRVVYEGDGQEATMAKAKYGAVPMNAIGDPRMTLHRFRVLAAVASYDRFTKNGIGCMAGLKGLAKATGLYGSHVSGAVNDLVEMGYLIRGHSLFDRRRMTLRVVYEGDEIVSAGANQLADEIVTPSCNHLSEIVTPGANQLADEVVSASCNYSSEIVSGGDEKEVPDQGVTDCNILSKALDKKSCETKRDSRKDSIHSDLEDIPPEAERDIAGSDSQEERKSTPQNGATILPSVQTLAPPFNAYEALVNRLIGLGLDRSMGTLALMGLQKEVYDRLAGAIEGGTLPDTELKTQLERGLEAVHG